MTAVNILNTAFLAIIFNVKNVYMDVQPYYVSVELALVPICSGTIVHPAWVLTVAHCLHDGRSSVLDCYFITVSKSSLNGTELNRRQCERIILHYEYRHSDPRIHDIALIKLNTSFEATSVIKVSSFFILSMSNSCIAMNQVFNDYGLTNGSMVQQRVRPINGDLCSKRFWDWAHFLYNYCVLGIDSSPCTGRLSLGGPLVCGGIQVAVATWYPDICKKNWPVLYTNIDMYDYWINERIARSINHTSHLYLVILLVLLVYCTQYFCI